MKRRVVLWATVGLLIGCIWVVYAFAAAPDVEVQRSVGNWALQVFAYATCPATAAGPRFYWIPLANAATYALLGVALELIWRK